MSRTNSPRKGSPPKYENKKYADIKE